MFKKLVSINLCLALLWTSGSLAEAVGIPSRHFPAPNQITQVAPCFNQEAMIPGLTLWPLSFSIFARLTLIHTIILSLWSQTNDKVLGAMHEEMPGNPDAARRLNA